MRRKILFFIINFISLSLFSQKAIEITNNSGNEYTQVEGTSIELLLPAGFTPNENIIGFDEVLTGSSITILETKIDVYKSFLSLNRNDLFQKGIVVNAEGYYLINGFDAFVVEGVQQTQEGGMYYKMMLMIGNIYKTTLISIQVPNYNPESVIPKYEKILLSVIFHPEKTFGIQNIEIKYDTTGTGFILTNTPTRALTFTEDGKYPTESANHTSFAVKKFPVTTQLDDEKKKAVTLQIIKQFQLESSDEPQIVKYQIDGYDTYQSSIIGFVPKMMKNQLVFVALIFVENDFYIVNAFSSDEFLKSRQKFERFLKTFKFI